MIVVHEIIHILIGFTVLGLVLTRGQYVGVEFNDVDEDLGLECPDQVGDVFLRSFDTPFGMPDRALKSVPPGFSIRTSSIPDAGLGAFAETFVPQNTWLAEYEGMIVPANYVYDDTDQTYMWRVKQEGEIAYYVDGISPVTSNWLRYINCPRNPSEENVEMHYCYGKVYYRTFKDVLPGQELLVYYGSDYAKHLGINHTLFEIAYNLNK